MRPAALIATLLTTVALIGGGCGPLDATQKGGERADPVALLTVLPSPDALRGTPARQADAAALARAFTGVPDDELARRVRDRTPAAAGVRSWREPEGGELVAAVSVWGTHLTATGVGADIATLLVADGGRAWTPQEIPGARGARVDAEGRRELRLAYSVGPNSLFVRGSGPISDEIVVRTLNRMIKGLAGQSG